MPQKSVWAPPARLYDASSHVSCGGRQRGRRAYRNAVTARSPISAADAAAVAGSSPSSAPAITVFGASAASTSSSLRPAVRPTTSSRRSTTSCPGCPGVSRSPSTARPPLARARQGIHIALIKFWFQRQGVSHRHPPGGSGGQGSRVRGLPQGVRNRHQGRRPPPDIMEEVEMDAVSMAASGVSLLAVACVACRLATECVDRTASASSE